MKSIQDILGGKKNMKRLTKLEKLKIILDLRAEGWRGSMEDYYLYRLAWKVMEKQLCLEK